MHIKIFLHKTLRADLKTPSWLTETGNTRVRLLSVFTRQDVSANHKKTQTAESDR